MISWIRHHGRSADLADRLGATGYFIAAGEVANPRTAPFRWVLQACRTTALLMRERPTELVLMAPPWLLVVIAVLYRTLRFRRVALVVDAHTSAVLNRRGAVTRGIRILGPRCDLVLVHNDELGARLAGSRCNVVVLHDPPVRSLAPAAEPRPTSTPFTFLFPCSWFGDEPIEEVIAAAALVPQAAFVLTGRADPARVPASLPANVRLTGFLPADDYASELVAADATLALTNRQATMQRAGYEAMALGKPIVASDTNALRAYFGGAAVYVPSVPDRIADGCRAVIETAEELGTLMRALAVERSGEFDAALLEVQRCLKGARR